MRTCDEDLDLMIHKTLDLNEGVPVLFQSELLALAV